VPSESSPDNQTDERVLSAVGVAPGIAIGPAFLYLPDPPDAEPQSIAPPDVEPELQALADALDHARGELQTIATLAEDKLDAESAAIFDAQRLMLEDDAFLSTVRDRIRSEHESAAHAFTTVLRTHQRRLETSDNAYFQDRAGDLMDLRDRVVRALRSGTLAGINADTVVLADTLSAADVLRFSRHGVLGCAARHGGATSHVSILARALEMPALVGLDTLTDHVANGDRVILDGLRGRLIVHPTERTVETYRARQARYQELVREQTQGASPPTKTQDGRRVTLRANVEFREELGLLERYGAEGIGLLRTEMLFLTRPGCTMTEDEQVEVYRAAAEAAGPAGVTLRLLDLGGDKHLPVGHREPNPFLGWRGVRVLLDRPELLRPQLRAVLRANVEGRFRMLLPMVTTLDDVEHIRQALADEADRLSQRGIAHDASLPLGVMVEVPAVALQAEQFAEAVDFFSIGTNDLTQYTLAVDRGNDRVAHRYDAVHPAVLRLIRQTVRAARENDVPTTLCGEVASDPEAIPLLVGLGVDALSASPTYLPSIQRVVRHLSAAETSSLVAAALDAPDAASVRTRTRDWLREHLDVDLPDVQRLRPQPLSPDRAASAESASDGPAASQSDEDGTRSHGGLRSARFDPSPDVSPES